MGEPGQSAFSIRSPHPLIGSSVGTSFLRGRTLGVARWPFCQQVQKACLKVNPKQRKAERRADERGER